MAKFYVVITPDDLDALIDDFKRRKIVLDLDNKEEHYFESLAIPFESTLPEVEILKEDLAEEMVYFLDADRKALLDG